MKYFITRYGAFASVCLLALALRLVAACHARGLWADEVSSVSIATGHSLAHSATEARPELGDFVEWPDARPAREFGRYLRHTNPPATLGRVLRAILLADVHPPLYYVLLSGWSRLVSPADWLLRTFSILWAIAALPLLWLVGSRVGGRGTAMQAGLLYSLAPAGIYYSEEIRSYSLVWFLATALVWCSLRLHDHGRPRDALLWAVVGAAGLLAHYFFSFVWAICALWLWFAPGRSSRGRLTGAIVLVALLIVPWYVQLPASVNRWRVDAHWLDGRLTPSQIVTVPLRLGWSVLSPRGPWGANFATFDAVVRPALFAWLAFLALPRRFRFTAPGVLIALWAVAACAGPVLFDLLRGTHASTVPRYALPAMPAIVLLTSLMLNETRSWQRLAFVLLLVVDWHRGILDVLTDRMSPRGYNERVGAALTGLVGSSDVVIVHSHPANIIATARQVPDDTSIAGWVVQLGARRVPGSLTGLLQGHRRAALVMRPLENEQVPTAEERWVRTHARILRDFTSQGLPILYFEPHGLDGRWDQEP